MVWAFFHYFLNTKCVTRLPLETSILIKTIHNHKSIIHINLERIVCGASVASICIWRLVCTHIWCPVILRHCHYHLHQNDLLMVEMNWHSSGRWLVGCNSCHNGRHSFDRRMVCCNSYCSNRCSNWSSSHWG